VNTPWGNLDICDAHVHFFSRSFFRALGGKEPDGLAASLNWEIPSDDIAALAALWVQQMERYGLKRLALIASVPGDEGSVAGAVRAYPQHFTGYFMLNPLSEDAAERTRQALEHLGLRGICLFPAMHKFSVQDERLRPIYELAAQHHAVVFVHMGALSVGVRKKLGFPSPFDMRYSNPIELHSIALEFSAVSFVIPHFGAGYFRETLMLGDLCPNVYVDTSSSNSWMRYTPGINDLKEVFRRALDVFGAARILFGTDSSFFPRGWNAEIFQVQVDALSAIGIGAKDAAAMLGGNLQRIAK